MKEKLMASMLAISLAATAAVIPQTAEIAAAGTAPQENSGLVVNKTATLQDDGTYQIQLEAYATGDTVTTTQESGVPLDIVLVIDQSGSMAGTKLTTLKNTVTNFVNSVAENQREVNEKGNDVEHRISIVGFASDNTVRSSSYWENTGVFVNGSLKNYSSSTSTTNQITDAEYANSMVPVLTDDTVTSSITKAISNFKAEGGTMMNWGLKMANNVLKNTDDGNSDRQKYVIVFTDGTPGGTGWDNKTAAQTIVEGDITKTTYGATVYTVGVDTPTSSYLTQFMNRLSSNSVEYQNVSSNYSTTGLYYQLKDGAYAPIYYSKRKWYDHNGSSISSVGTVYLPSKFTGNYYLQSSNAADLDDMFQTISSEITNPTTTVTLDAQSIVRDIISADFQLPENFDVTKHVAVQVAAGKNTNGSISFGTPAASLNTQVNVVRKSADSDYDIVEVSGFDFSKEYIAPTHDGHKLIITIQGVEALPSAATNESVATNGAASGIYANAPASYPAKVFPQPDTIIPTKAVIIDYARAYNVSGTALGQSNMHSIKADMTKASAQTTQFTYGRADKGGDNSIEYVPTTSIWDGVDRIYVFGESDDARVLDHSANANGNVWSELTVLPATSVYYEDTFVTSEANGTVGIEYAGKDWKPGEGTSSTEFTFNDDVQGNWNTTDNAHSGGTWHEVTTTQDSLAVDATAYFRFVGTGVDIYSQTDIDSGNVTVRIDRVTTDEQGKETTKLVKMMTVDTTSHSGTYYNIPVVSFENLEYGNYKVTIRVTNISPEQKTFRLCGIRVYNPLGNNYDSDVANLYGETGSLFQQVKTLLDTDAKHTAFIDKDDEGKPGAGSYLDSTIAKLAPGNEVYLNNGHAIVLKVSGGTKYYIGMKSPDGIPVTARISQSQNGREVAQEIEVNTSNDLYYEVTPSSDGTIVIANAGSGEEKNLLALTKIRVATTEENGLASVAFEPVNSEMALAAYSTFQALPTATDTVTPGITEDEFETGPADDGEDDSEIQVPDVTVTYPETPGNTNSFVDRFSKLLNSFANLFR